MENIKKLMDQEIITQVVDPKELENMSIQDLIDKRYITHNISSFDIEESEQTPTEPEVEPEVEPTDNDINPAEDAGDETPTDEPAEDDAPVIDENTEE